MPIAMVFTLMPAFLVVASLFGTLESGSGSMAPVLAALTLLAGTVIGLFRFMRTIEEDVAVSAPGEHINEAPGGRTSDAPDHDFPMVA